MRSTSPSSAGETMQFNDPPTDPQFTTYQKKEEDFLFAGSAAKGKQKGRKPDAPLVSPSPPLLGLERSDSGGFVFAPPGPSVDHVGEEADGASAVPAADTTAAELGPARRRTKYVDLESATTSDFFRVSGRERCECLATRHELVNNCLGCGRIVCAQEGSGPCFFCGHDVLTREQQEVLNRGSKRSKKLQADLDKLRSEFDAGVEAARVRRDRLLDYDRNSAARSKIYDDESDYFETNKWQSDGERAATLKRADERRDAKERARRERKVAIEVGTGGGSGGGGSGGGGGGGLSGRVVELGAEKRATSSELAQLAATDIAAGLGHGEASVDTVLQWNAALSDAPHNLRFRPPIFQRPLVDSATPHIPAAAYARIKAELAGGIRRALRVQDAGFQEVADVGVCLSMHQPWASLLVAGIKEVEGRSWYSSHRGRLWIASTVKAPTADQVRAVEEDTRLHRRLLEEGVADTRDAFPAAYPTSVLLGCVNVVDCLSHQEYAAAFPDAADRVSESPYVFMVGNPMQLPLCLPIKGQHKIWKLDPAVHQAARVGLARRAKLLAEQ